MDRERFDTITRLAWTASSRRAALGLLIGAVLLGHDPVPGAAKPLAARKSKKRKSKKPAADPCYPGRACIPGPGRDNAGCDFSFSTTFRDRDASGSQLGKSSFRGADLRGADFQGADLGGACFVGADLEGAKLGGAALNGATFCNTVLPDGTVDDSGCDQTTPCCPPLELDCPDATIKCGIDDGAGFCSKVVGRLGPVARCGAGLCCGPCQNNDELYWTNQCNATFPECRAEGCVASDDGLAPCWTGCVG